MLVALAVESLPVATLLRIVASDERVLTGPLVLEPSAAPSDVLGEPWPEASLTEALEESV